MLSITGRKFTEEDKEELNDSWNRFTGRSRTVTQFEWEWLNTPEGWGSIWVLEGSDTGKIVGCHGLIPIRLSYFGRSILSGKTENTHLHPPHAGKGLYRPLEARFVEEAKGRFDLLFNTTQFTRGSGAPGAVRIKVGYIKVGRYAHYIKVTKRTYLNKVTANIINKKIDNRFIAAILAGAAKLGSVFLMSLFSRRGPIDRTVTLRKVPSIDTVAEELDKFWGRNSGKFGITVDRNSRYLKWRIFDNPNLSYEFFLAMRQRQVVGYVITKSTERAGVKLGTIVDLIADDNNEVIFNSILDRVEGMFRENGIYMIHFPTLLSGNSLNRALKGNGFVPFLMLRKLVRRALGKGQQESVFMAKALDDRLDPAKVSDPACWYCTDIFSEGRG